MAQHFLYTFEFIIGDLLITRVNKCAPEEYPTCVEVTFRSSVFVSICDREDGSFCEPCGNKCGKACLFALESPVTDSDRILLHVYKKKNENCKFLLGATEMPIKNLFDKVTNKFDTQNPSWMASIARHHANMIDPRLAVNRNLGPPPSTIDYCYDEIVGRREQFCLTSEVTKGLLPLFNARGDQTGNIMLMVRLICSGPAIVSQLGLGAICKRKSRTASVGAYSVCPTDPCKSYEKPQQCRRYFKSCSRTCPF